MTMARAESLPSGGQNFLLRSIEPTCDFLTFYFFGALLRRHQACDTVVDRELAVVFAGVFDQPIGHVGDADLLVAERIDQADRRSLVTFRFDRGGAVGESLFYEGNHFGFGLVSVALGVFLGGKFLSHGEVGKEIVGVGGWSNCSAKLRWAGVGLKSYLSSGKSSAMAMIFLADIIPGFENGLATGWKRV